MTRVSELAASLSIPCQQPEDSSKPVNDNSATEKVSATYRNNETSRPTPLLRSLTKDRVQITHERRPPTRRVRIKEEEESGSFCTIL